MRKRGPNDVADRAVQIFNKIYRDGETRAVIKAGGMFRTCRADEVLDQQLRKCESRLVGVYDRRCRLEWLQDDLDWAYEHMP